MVFKLCPGGNLYDALHIRGWEPTLAESIAVALDFGVCAFRFQLHVLLSLRWRCSVKPRSEGAS